MKTLSNDFTIESVFETTLCHVITSKEIYISNIYSHNIPFSTKAWAIYLTKWNCNYGNEGKHELYTNEQGLLTFMFSKLLTWATLGILEFM
jgi:hypothetical protein